MIRRKYESAPGLPYFLRFQRLQERQAQLIGNGAIQTLHFQAIPDLLEIEKVQVQGHLRMLRLEGPDERQTFLRKAHPHDSHTERPGSLSRSLPDCSDHFLFLGKQGFALLQKYDARISQPGIPFRPLHQRQAQFTFQCSHLLRKRRLGNVKRLRSLRETSILRQRLKSKNILFFHSILYSFSE